MKIAPFLARLVPESKNHRNFGVIFEIQVNVLMIGPPSLGKLSNAVHNKMPMLPLELRDAIIKDSYDTAIIREKFKAITSKEEAIELYRSGVFSQDFVFEMLAQSAKVRFQKC
jgi:hypothetical protein